MKMPDMTGISIEYLNRSLLKFLSGSRHIVIPVFSISRFIIVEIESEV